MKHLYIGSNTALLLAVALLAFPGSNAAAASVQVDATGPSQLIESSASSMLKELDAHREEYRKDPKKVYALVDKILLPHFDTGYAAQQVLGTHWRTATPEQRQRFINAFYKSLLQNYGDALVDFTADRMTVLPFNGDANSTRATVRTRVRRDNGSGVDVFYSLRKTDAGWKVFDVVIDGISYVSSFRQDFSTEIAQKGLDAVIQRLEANGVKAALGR